MTPEEFSILKKKVEALRRDADKAAGALEQIRAKLKGEHGCESVKQAKEQWTSIRTDLAAAGEEFEEKVKAFEKENREALERDER